MGGYARVATSLAREHDVMPQCLPRGKAWTYARMSVKFCVQTGRCRHHILAFANRIDTDLETLLVTNRTPTGILMLDGTLAKIGARQETTDTRSWIKGARGRGRGLCPRPGTGKAPPARHPGAAGWKFHLAFSRRHDTLDRRERRWVWAFGTRRHHEAEREIKLRIGNVLLSDDIPDPRDVA